MLKTGILNPQLNSLLSRVRHTNSLVIADRGFPYWPNLETVDIALVDNIPTVLQVLTAILPNFSVGEIYMAAEFKACNTPETQAALAGVLGPLAVSYLPHADFKLKVPQSVGLIRTGDGIQYANMILVSA